jgi:predicted DCC family thiol-disulfide oxidoreductase YuxK
MTSIETQSGLKPNWKIKLLYDGQCPLCVREVNFLLKKDADRGIVNFVDIADLNYNPQEHGNIDFETAMGRIHAITNDGTIIRNVEAFRRIYEELAMGWVYAATKLPIIGNIANWLYGIWADWRLKLTGRPNIEVILAEREQTIKSETGRCRLDR